MDRVILAALLAVSLGAQTPANNRPKKVFTPEQLAYQKAMKDYNLRRDKLRSVATAAYNSELARERAPECPGADNTRDFTMCLGHEIDLTDVNYKTFTTTLRSILSVSMPASPGETTPFVGLTGQEGTPATNTAAFDAAESAWQAYAKAECSATDTLWRGGTIVSSIVAECELRMARSRMRELDTAYEMELHPH